MFNGVQRVTELSNYIVFNAVQQVVECSEIVVAMPQAIIEDTSVYQAGDKTSGMPFQLMQSLISPTQP